MMNLRTSHDEFFAELNWDPDALYSLDSLFQDEAIASTDQGETPSATSAQPAGAATPPSVPPRVPTRPSRDDSALLYGIISVPYTELSTTAAGRPVFIFDVDLSVWPAEVARIDVCAKVSPTGDEDLYSVKLTCEIHRGDEDNCQKRFEGAKFLSLSKGVNENGLPYVKMNDIAASTKAHLHRQSGKQRFVVHCGTLTYGTKTDATKTIERVVLQFKAYDAEEKEIRRKETHCRKVTFNILMEMLLHDIKENKTLRRDTPSLVVALRDTLLKHLAAFRLDRLEGELKSTANNTKTKEDIRRSIEPALGEVQPSMLIRFIEDDVIRFIEDDVYVRDGKHRKTVVRLKGDKFLMNARAYVCEDWAAPTLLTSHALSSTEMYAEVPLRSDRVKNHEVFVRQFYSYEPLRGSERVSREVLYVESRLLLLDEVMVQRAPAAQSSTVSSGWKRSGGPGGGAEDPSRKRQRRDGSGDQGRGGGGGVSGGSGSGGGGGGGGSGGRPIAGGGVYDALALLFDEAAELTKPQENESIGDRLRRMDAVLHSCRSTAHPLGQWLDLAFVAYAFDVPSSGASSSRAYLECMRWICAAFAQELRAHQLQERNVQVSVVPEREGREDDVQERDVQERDVHEHDVDVQGLVNAITNAFVEARKLRVAELAAVSRAWGKQSCATFMTNLGAEMSFATTGGVVHAKGGGGASASSAQVRGLPDKQAELVAEHFANVQPQLLDHDRVDVQVHIGDVKLDGREQEQAVAVGDMRVEVWNGTASAVRVRIVVVSDRDHFTLLPENNGTEVQPNQRSVLDKDSPGYRRELRSGLGTRAGKWRLLVIVEQNEAVYVRAFKYECREREAK